jgi:protein SCO1/2
VKHPHVAPTTVSAAAIVAALAGQASCLLVGIGDARAATQQWTQQPGGDQPITNATPPALQGVDIVENLGGALPGDATFRDTEGKAVRLGDFFDGKRPVLFVFAYHTCPMLCSLVLDATVKALNDVTWTVGDQFDVVSMSIDPKDSPDTATKKRAQVVDSYARAHGSTKGWHFLTGEESQIRKVTDAIGFKYQYDPRQKQYAHPAAIYLLTPEGHIARYLYGIQYDPGDIRLGLLEASEGKSISTTERVLLFCYHYDPQGKKYSLVAMNVMRLGGGVTLVLLGSFLTLMWVRERRKRRERGEREQDATSASAQAATPARDATGAHLS